jgi:hypothetical protein
VNKLASAFHGALVSCPAVAALGADQALHVRLSLKKGKLKAPAPGPSEAAAACVAAALDGRAILPDTESMELIAELRARRNAGT